MIFKTVAVGMLLAFAVDAFAMKTASAASTDPVSRPRRGTPQVPQPRVPTIPRQPNIPGVPDPGKFPKLPLPGEINPKGGPEVPFPLSTTLPFPWGNIEGTWKVISDNVTVLFTFSVQTDTLGHQYLRVLQIDRLGQVLAEGVGIGVESDKLVRAAMTSKVSKTNYMLFIGSYKNTGAHSMGAGPSVTVITVRPFTSLMGDDDVQVMVQKLSDSPNVSTELDGCTQD